MIKALPLLLTAAVLLAGCGSGAKEVGPVPTSVPAAEPTESVPAENTSTEGETSVGSAPSVASAPAPTACKPETGGDDRVFTNLTDVRVGAHYGFDRIVFEFSAPEPNPGGKGGIPSYEIRQAKPPFTRDGSGLPVDVYGDAFVHLVLQGSAGYDFDGNPTYAGPRTLTPGFGTLAQAVQTGDFEATMSWVLGLSRTTCWQVQELRNPDRLAIDFHHA